VRRYSPPLFGAGAATSNGPSFGSRSADPLNVGRVQALVAVLDLELYFLSLGERLETVHRDCREMHEDVFTALLLNEAVALGIIEPLHFPSGHSSCLLRGQTDPALRCAGQTVGGLRAPI